MVGIAVLCHGSMRGCPLAAVGHAVHVSGLTSLCPSGPTACQMCSSQHLDDGSYCYSQELDIFHIQVSLPSSVSASGLPSSVIPRDDRQDEPFL